MKTQSDKSYNHRLYNANHVDNCCIDTLSLNSQHGMFLIILIKLNLNCVRVRMCEQFCVCVGIHRQNISLGDIAIDVFSALDDSNLFYVIVWHVCACAQ